MFNNEKRSSNTKLEECKKLHGYYKINSDVKLVSYPHFIPYYFNIQKCNV